MTDAGTITLGSLVVIIDDIVYYDGSVWLKDNARIQLCSYVKIVNHENYNQNYLEAVDENIFKGIRFYVLKDWANVLSLETDSAKFENLYRMAIRNIDKYGFQLKKVLV